MRSTASTTLSDLLHRVDPLPLVTMTCLPFSNAFRIWLERAVVPGVYMPMMSMSSRSREFVEIGGDRYQCRVFLDADVESRIR